MTSKKPRSMIDSVYGRLRDLILSNELRPGQKLVDRDLARQLGVSRTPVREALGRLTMMGLIETQSGRGYFVRQYTAEQIFDLYEFRKILEINASRLAAKKAKTSHLRKFEDVLIKLETLAGNPTNLVKTVEVDFEIHGLIGLASGNESLHQAILNMLDKVMCTVWVNWVDAASSDRAGVASYSEHQGLIERIIEGDADGAAEIMDAHIDNARDELANTLRARDDLRRFVLEGAAP